MISTSITCALKASFTLLLAIFKTYEKNYRCVRSKEVFNFFLNSEICYRYDKLVIGPRAQGVIVLVILSQSRASRSFDFDFSLNCFLLGPIFITNKSNDNDNDNGNDNDSDNDNGNNNDSVSDNKSDINN